MVSQKELNTQALFFLPIFMSRRRFPSSAEEIPLAVPNRQDIERAAERISGSIKSTPVLRSGLLRESTGIDLFFKMESLMPDVGAFKARGALNALLSHAEESGIDQMERGVVTFSSGNHAQAIAWAVRHYRTVLESTIPAYIVMPSTTKQIKQNGVRRLGGKVIIAEPGVPREEKVEEVQKRTLARFIHPFDDYRVIAGQATAGRELLLEHPKIQEIVVPVGGGGLISGTALAANHFSPHTKVIGAEPEGADDAARSLAAGFPQKNETVNTIADGLLTNVGEKTFPIIQQFVDRIDAVSDEDIINAMRVLWQEMRVIVEPSGAVALAAILKNQEKFSGKKVGVIVSGGNIDVQEAFNLMYPKE